MQGRVEALDAPVIIYVTMGDEPIVPQEGGENSGETAGTAPAEQV